MLRSLYLNIKKLLLHSDHVLTLSAMVYLQHNALKWMAVERWDDVIAKSTYYAQNQPVMVLIPRFCILK